MRTVKHLTPEQITACEAERLTVMGTHSAKKTSIKWRTVAARLGFSTMSVLRHFSPDDELKQYLGTINRCESRRPSKRIYIPKRAPVGELDLEVITRHYRQGMSTSFIAPKLPQGIGRATIKRIFAELEPQFGAERAAAILKHKSNWKEQRKLDFTGRKKVATLGILNATVGPRVPEYLIAERDKRLQAYYELPEHMRLMGDPAPGQSALDKR